MSDDQLKAKLDVFKMVNDHYRNDFQLFWQRTNFFLLVEAGLLGFFVSKAQTVELRQFFTFVVCLSGVALSVIWFLVAVSSIRWIDTWRREVVRIDSDINPYRSFSAGENVTPDKWEFHLRFRPEVVSAWLPLLFFVVWMFLTVLPIR